MLNRFVKAALTPALAILVLMNPVLTSAAAWGEDLKDGADGSGLVQTVRSLDAALFDAYNRCNLDALGAMVADDLEFYHDVTGLSRGKAPFLAAIKTNICGKVHRDLIASSFEAYPLKNYGAVETGAHVFCAAGEAPCDPAKAGTAKFVMLWQQVGTRWMLTRVISYQHISDWQRRD